MSSSCSTSSSTSSQDQNQEDFQYEIYEKFFLKSPDRIVDNSGLGSGGESTNSSPPIISREINLNTLNSIDQEPYHPLSFGQKELFDFHSYSYDATSQFELLNAESSVL